MSVGASGGGWDALIPKLSEALAPKYEIIRMLGHGGMAGVYLAEEVRLGRKVAIKVISPSLVMDPSFVPRFEQEARATARLRHSSIVTIYEVDHKADFVYIAMSYCSGRTLGQVMREEAAAIPFPVVLTWLYDVAGALDHAHHRGITHRDIKPGNILLDDEGSALVADFGIAKVADQPGLTSTGFLVGTPTYMSPEQCTGVNVTHASDQYSLGIVAYEMIAGSPPFSGQTMQVITSHMSQEPQPLIEVRPDCPPELSAAIMRMLEKDAADRWPSASEAIQAGGGGPARPGDPVYKTMTLLAKQVSAIQVSASTVALQPSEEFAIEAVPLDAQHTPLPSRHLTWTSSDPLIAEVARDGTVTAKAPGRVTLAVRGGTALQSIEVEVAGAAPLAPGLPSAETPFAGAPQATVAQEEATMVADSTVLPPVVSDELAAPARSASDVSAEPDPALEEVASEGLDFPTDHPPLAVPEASLTELFSGAAPAVEPGAPSSMARPPAAPVSGDKAPPSRRWILAGGAVGVAAVVVLALTQLGGDPSIDPASEGQPVSQANVEPPTTTPSADDESSELDATPTDDQAEQSPSAETQPQPPPVTPSPATETQPAATPPANGRIRLRGSTPTGGTVTAVGPDRRTRQLSGTTQLPPGRYRVTATAPGYEAEEVTLNVTGGASQDWTPAWTQVTAPSTPDPVTEAAPAANVLTPADVAAINSAVDGFVAAFRRLDTGVVLPLIPDALRDGYSQMLTLDYSRFDVTAGGRGAPVLNGDVANVRVPLTIDGLMLGQPINEALVFNATLVRSGDGWTIQSMAPAG